MNPATRNAILRGIGAATEAHDAFHLREKHADGQAPIDVFSFIQDLEIPLLFKPLDKLLGACVRIGSSTIGILITTQRDIHLQRFTAAHELGHFILEHEGSMDREVRFPGDTLAREIPEIEADAFAAEFLLPRWLIKTIAARNGWWTSGLLSDPRAVYQLSLRLSASYEATWRALRAHGYIDQSSAEALRKKSLKTTKSAILSGIQLHDPWADVWEISATDNGARLLAGSRDVFFVRVDEATAAGYQWTFTEFIDAGFRLLGDTTSFDDSTVGGPSVRCLVFGAAPPGEYELALPLRRAFSPSAPAYNVLHLTVSTEGAHREGLMANSTSAREAVH